MAPPPPIKAHFQDARLDNLRTALAQSAGASQPFLLLPVRLETRFMTVDRPLAAAPTEPAEQLLDLLNALGQLHIDLVDAMPPPPAACPRWSLASSPLPTSCAVCALSAEPRRAGCGSSTPTLPPM